MGLMGSDLMRFLAKFDQGDGCWVWKRPKIIGYGYLWLRDRERPAHRISYEHYVGPIPEGLEIDHLCRNRACVNPAHLEAVPHRENMRRSPIMGRPRATTHVTHCVHGHLYDEANSYFRPNGSRVCRECNKLQQRKEYKKLRRENKRLERENALLREIVLSPRPGEVLTPEGVLTIPIPPLPDDDEE